jgi:hypothetical protein
VAGGAEPVGQRVEVGDGADPQARMSLAGGREGLLDADVQLAAAAAEPRAAARRERGGLRHLAHAEQTAVERARSLLAAGRSGDLNVVDARDQVAAPRARI